MDRSRWIRSPEKIRATLTKLADNSVVTSKGCKIYIPKRFAEKQLATIAAETYIVGIFAIVVEDKYYGVSTTNAMMRITPSGGISTVKFDGDSYLEFAFEPGSVVIADTQLIRSDTLVYKIFDEIIAKGHIPWYVGYEDLAKLFSTAARHAGVNLSGSHAILEMFAAAIARDSQDRSRYYRHTVQSQDDQNVRPPTIIPLRSVGHGATNTTAKLLGSYFDDGLTSALVNPSQKTERIEELLRR
jgi:hypothetical protein